MNKQRIRRMNRIIRFEQSKLDELTHQLFAANQELQSRLLFLEKTKLRLETVVAEPSQDSVSRLRQLHVWTDRTSDEITLASEAVAVAEQQCDALVSDLKKQKATIKGWELLVDRLQSEDAMEQEKSGILDADDSFLRTFKGSTQ